jgi:hypothetical protein
MSVEEVILSCLFESNELLILDSELSIVLSEDATETNEASIIFNELLIFTKEESIVEILSFI